MNIDMKNVVIGAIGVLVRPIVRLALRNGITFREFTDLCRGEYVQVAAQDYGVHGRETNVSRIALITGINRKDIKRLKDAISNGDDVFSSQAPSRISRIITGWHDDGEFLSESGAPRDLDIEGPLGFGELVRRYGGDVALVTVIRELKKAKVLEELPSGQLKILKRFYIPNPSSDPESEPEFVNPRAIQHASSILGDHINTIFHNLYRHDTKEPLRFERRATNNLVRKEVVPAFRAFVEQRAQQYLVDIDEWLSANEVQGHPRQNKCVRLGMGTYWIEGIENITEEAG